MRYYQSMKCMDQPQRELVVTDTLVSVGTNPLHFQIIEGGIPTILLEAGGGMDMSEWVGLAPKMDIMRTTRVPEYIPVVII